MGWTDFPGNVEGTFNQEEEKGADRLYPRYYKSFAQGIMSGNRNSEPDEGGGGGSWSSALCVAAAAVSGFLWWQNREAKRKIKEMEVKLQRNTGYMRCIHVISFLDAQYQKENPSEYKEKLLLDNYEIRKTLFLLSKLDNLEDLLVERQHLYCSYFTSKNRREMLEKKMRESGLNYFGIPTNQDLNTIFSGDRHCASCLSYLLTGDKRKNGDLMWKMLEEWRKRLNENVKQDSIKKILEDETFQR
ncbi:uncharacterized protein LOC103147904 isoform X1 [Poecilia formosa]|uniref:uncharacterized protein LOC103147904 isoform X1 n=2 Tax=Poecilia formosa TaxID=48698 RepID=UPI0007BA199C|nr:PREDICTED: uncharacterized protein LOC103147904 isoform X1 [Poecilia formosa]